MPSFGNFQADHSYRRRPGGNSDPFNATFTRFGWFPPHLDRVPLFAVRHRCRYRARGTFKYIPAARRFGRAIPFSGCPLTWTPHFRRSSAHREHQTLVTDNCKGGLIDIKPREFRCTHPFYLIYPLRVLTGIQRLRTSGQPWDYDSINLSNRSLYRLLLEFARVTSVDRDAMSYRGSVYEDNFDDDDIL